MHIVSGVGYEAGRGGHGPLILTGSDARTGSAADRSSAAP